jgi:ribosome-associated translation inhibitor RaiA
LVSLHLCYDRHPRKRAYVATLNLNLPAATLHACATHIEARSALRKAFDDIEMQINKHQRRLRKDYEWKRKRLRRPATAEA